MRTESNDAKEWNVYWGNQSENKGIYELIAEFYRKFIIKRTLNHFVNKYFKQRSEILHAGCGSGRVDEDISQTMSITALDISKKALEIYSKINKSKCKIMLGSIFDIPAVDNTFDGIYNLGVMEHFTLKEIHKILLEFNRVLKKDGIMIIFWPPEFGLTVLVLKIINPVVAVINAVLNKDIKLHPKEISRVISKKQIINIFEKANFKVIKYYFGPMDFFTHSIIIARKTEHS